MNPLWLALAQVESGVRQEVIERLRSGFTRELASRELYLYVLAGLALLGLLLLAWRCLGRNSSPKAAPPPDYLALGASLLNLTREQRADLVRLARHAQLPEPAAMLLSPANLAYGFERGSSRTGDPELRRRLEALCLSLFAVPLPARSGSPREPA